MAEFRDTVEKGLLEIGVGYEGLVGEKLWSKSQSCGGFWTGECEEHGVRHRLLSRCGLRGCPNCMRYRRRKLVKEFSALVEGVEWGDLRASMFSYPLVGFAGLARTVRLVLAAAVRALKPVCKGALVVCEIKPKVGGLWYVHLHGLVVLHHGVRDFMYSEVNRRYRRFVGVDNAYAGSERLRSSKFAYASYIIGYITKGWKGVVRSRNRDGVPADGSPGKLVDMIEALKGVRLYRAFGCMLGRRLREQGSSLPLGLTMRRKGAIGKPVEGSLDLPRASEASEGAYSLVTSKHVRRGRGFPKCDVCQDDLSWSWSVDAPPSDVS